MTPVADTCGVIRMWLVTAAAVVAILAPSIGAQTPSAQTRPDFSGTWTLDTEASTDLAKITLIPSAGSARQPSGTRRRNGGGFGGRGFDTGRSREQSSAPKLTNDEQARLKAIADMLKTGWAKLTIALHDPSFVVNDARDRTLFFTTDGNAADSHVGDFTLSTTSRWEGDRVITECAVGPNITLVYSYTLVANMKRLVVRVGRKDGQNTRSFEPDVYLFYRRTA